ncbi:hypothetical protein [Dokdonella sp.]|uniref:hypothetical protein n=1 Tax=Dokdonella sp. TaxID=2291710 RepID=UPI003528A558
MTKTSLSSLYRQMSAQQCSAATDLLDADTLVAASAGTLRGDRRDEVASRLSRSPLQTDLVRMLGDLAPASAELASAVRKHKNYSHSRTGQRVRHASGTPRHVRHLRWVGLAACLMLVFGAVFWQPQGHDPMSGTARSESRPDRIFTSKDRIFAMSETGSSSSVADDLFRSDFNGG